MMKRSAATISSTSTPRPSALSPCTVSKLSRLCGPETSVTDGAMPQTRIVGREGAGAELGEAGEADLGDGVAEEIRIGRGELGVEQVDDQPVARARGEGARQQSRRAQIDVEMGGPALRREVADVVVDEARGVVDQQPRRRQAVERRDDRLGRARIGELGLDRGAAELGRQRLGLGLRAIASGSARASRRPRARATIAAPIRFAPPVTIAVCHGLARIAARFAQGQPRRYRPVMPMAPVPDDLAGLSLAEIARLAEEQRLPPVEKWNPTPLRRQRDADRARRHLVPRGLADRPAGDGAAVLDHPAARAGRRLRAGDAGREARHRGRGRAVRRGRAEERGRGRGPHPRLPAQHRRPGRRRARTIRCASKREAASLSRGPRAASRRWSPGRSITSWPRSRWPKARPAGRVERRRLLRAGAGADEPRRRRLREALEAGHRESPELIGGDVLERGDRRRRHHARRRCWSPSSTGPSRP